MSSTLSMWLGIAFLLLGLVAFVLQAWLWRFPMEPDPTGRDPNGRSTAPRGWTKVHRIVGAAFVVIYAIMMWEMIPRLWQYQVELPARTVIHACMGITIGFLLVTKIAIIRWFQHFGKALPRIGLGIMLCTLILSVLSLPYALRAHDFGRASTPENLQRTANHLADLGLDRPVAELATERGLAEGRAILTGKCVVCHDLRTILRRPYTPTGWHRVVSRMLDKPQFERALDLDDVAPVTAYLVAITPTIQSSLKQKRRVAQAQAAREAGLKQQLAVAVQAPADVLATPELDARAKALYEDACSQCHELSDVDDHGLHDGAAWRELVTRMISEEEAEIEPAEAELIIAWLTRHRGKPAPQ